MKEETRYGEAGLLKQGRLPGPLRRGGNRGQSDDASGSAKYGRWLAYWTGLAKRDRPEARQMATPRHAATLLAKSNILSICAKAFVADAASRSDRTGPLVASGDAGDRLAIYFNRGTLM